MNIKLGVAIVALLALGAAAVSVYAPDSWQNLYLAARGQSAGSVQDAMTQTEEPRFVLAQDAEEGGEEAREPEAGAGEDEGKAEEGAGEGEEGDEAKEGEEAEEGSAGRVPGAKPGEEEAPAAGADDPAAAVERFKEMDPRDIVEQKAQLAEEVLTSPWDREDPEAFIPETGRVDPLTRVREAVPDDLKPPRSGETDENEFSTYLLSQEASTFIEFIAPEIQVHNVLQVGLEKFASVSIAGNRATMREGSGSSFTVGMVDNIPLVANISCISIADDDVVIRLTVSGSGTDTSVSKDLHFIPR